MRHKRIQVLEKLDVDLDDPNSTYIEASRLKKRIIKEYAELISLTGYRLNNDFPNRDDIG